MSKNREEKQQPELYEGLTELNTEDHKIDMLPHHYEATLKTLMRVFFHWKESGIDITQPPEKIIEMFFDAEDIVVTNTSDEIKQKVQAKWKDSEDFQKAVKILEERKKILIVARKQEEKLYLDLAKLVMKSIPEEEKQAIRDKYEKEDWLKMMLKTMEEYFIDAYKRFKEQDVSSADEKMMEYAKERTPHTDPDKKLFLHRGFVEALQEAYNADPENAEITFRPDYDFVCVNCVNQSKKPPCVLDAGQGPDFKEITDRTIINEYGWEFNKSYKLGSLLTRLYQDMTRRRYALCGVNLIKDDEEFVKAWKEEIKLCIESDEGRGLLDLA
jgi:hypothetical protein